MEIFHISFVISHLPFEELLRQFTNCFEQITIAASGLPMANEK